MHDARNALSALSAAGEVLKRDNLTAALLHEAAAVVARQALTLVERVGELATLAHEDTNAGNALIVCDNVQLVARLAGLLSHAGYRIDVALSTVAGYDLLTRERPDVAVIDMRTSVGEARSLAWLARGAGFRGWLVGVEDPATGQGTPPSCSASGFDAVIAHGFTPTRLRAAMSEAPPTMQRT